MTSLHFSARTPTPRDTNGQSQARPVYTDPFDDLLADPGPSMPLFTHHKPSDGPSKGMDEASTPLSANFGSFISAPAPSNALDHPLIDLDSPSEVSQASATADFFDRYMDGAKERAGDNERRVLGEILEHESNPLFWTKPSSNDTKASYNSSSPLQDTSNDAHLIDHPQQGEPFNTGSLSQSPPSTTLPFHSPSSSPRSSMSALTLSRKWMPNLLSHNTLPTHTSPRRTILPVVTHSSPFASPIFVPPTGAPGFTGEHYWNKSGFEFQEQDKRLGHLDLVGRKESTNVVLHIALANQLRNSLPALSRLAKAWTLLYSLDQHGVSLHTLYSRCQSSKVTGTLVAVRDSNDYVFGVWLGEQLRPLPGAYYGDGESFLWRSGNVLDKEPPQIFKWTGKNEYVALCESGFISFGGGDGKYGLYVGADLTNGSSAYCPTFDNAILCSWENQDKNMTVYFECVGIEVWGVGN